MALTGSIIALDLATRTGFCIGAPGTRPQFGCHVLPSTGTDIGSFAAAFDGWLRKLVAETAPARIIFEAPILPRQTQLITVRKLTGLAYHTELIAKQSGVRCAEAYKQRVSKFFVGTARPDKRDTILIAQRHGFDVHDDNAADAIAVWAWAVHCYAPEHAARFAIGPLGAGRLSNGGDHVTSGRPASRPS